MTASREHIRLFLDLPLSADTEVILPREQTHYLRNVLRRGAGDPVGVFNGRDGEWRAVIQDLGKHAGRLAVREQIQPQRQNPDVWLLFAPIKKARIEMIIEKATELGVREIHPVLTEYTSPARLNMGRLGAITIEAAEQCGLVCVPHLHAPEKLQSLLDRWPGERKILYCDETGGGGAALAQLQDAAEKNSPWAILIGPEGGFSPQERARLQALPNALAVSLGPRILRADTAAIAALSLWQSVCGDWNGRPVAINQTAV